MVDSRDASSFEDRLERARCGDPSATGRLVEEHRSWLRRAAQRAMGNRAAQKQSPSDIAQQCLVIAADQVEQFRGNNRASLRGWLKAIQRNLVRKHLRGARKSLEHEQPLDGSQSPESAVAADQTSVVGRVARNEQLDWLGQAIEQLDSEDRRLIEARFFVERAEDRTSRELAASFGCRPEAFRKRLERLLEKLAAGIEMLQSMQRRGLPPHYRRILCAQHFRGLSVSGISAELGVDEKAARVLLIAAESKLLGSDRSEP